ncbi:MAG: DUF2933 domain-containing protein [Azoarcus sp.]|nr:DUF2933 domain-containing protein [Azoarcus sp.]
MNPTDHTGSTPSSAPERTTKRARLVFIAFVALAIFFLAAEHRAHLFGFLPWLILLLCPLMHFFMHGGHGHGGHGHGAHPADGTGDNK